MQVLIWGLKCLLSMLRCMLGSVKGVKSQNLKGKGKLGNENDSLNLIKIFQFQFFQDHLRVLYTPYRENFSKFNSFFFFQNPQNYFKFYENVNLTTLSTYSKFLLNWSNIK